MEIRTDLPMPAYYKICDNLEKRINDFQFRGSRVNVVDDKIIEIPITKKTLDECNELRIKLSEVKQLLELDNAHKIGEDIERLLRVVKSRLS